ncbi:hypothetical protein ASE21_20265 [Flavobacterium sp. Root901]|uniref:hypothetical protein n=1 Tax=Flavobacterium sp. Root901 TaxID=1736605 RepID=UPI0007112180|nr:hypothetical protein [Flavobacterium sp. Root901]KRD06492.1 hypothetical protein ASE21_20265 [Flavobacterium sp. Root901]
MNQYFVRARLFPTILTAIPIIIFINYVLNKELYSSLNQIYTILPSLAGFGISAAVIFLSIQINRIVSKELFQRIYFKEEIEMPTTKMLLWQDSKIDKNTKSKIRKKINEKFQIKLKNETEESSEIEESKKQIVFAVSQIRNLLRGNTFLFRHNIEYGFIRNLIGGSLIALIISIVILIYSYITKDNTLKITSVILVAIYTFPVIFSKFIIKKFGNYYAKTLYEQFLSEK